MLQSLFIRTYLCLHHYYECIWKFLFKWIGSILLIYYIEQNQMINITTNYYFGWNLDKYRSGTYYVKIYNIHGTSHIAYQGDLAHIQNTRVDPEEVPKRKHVVLLNNEQPLEINLEILDKYKANMKHFTNSVTNLGKITRLMGLQCSHISIIRLIPFNKETMHVDEVNIDYLYQNHNNV